MSNISLLLIRHDAAGVIEDNLQEFWRAAWHAIQNANSIPQFFGVAGIYPSGCAVCSHSEDGMLSLVAVGQGAAEMLACDQADKPFYNEEQKLKLLKVAAQKRGYRLTRIPAPRAKVMKKKKNDRGKKETKRGRSSSPSRKKSVR